MDLSTILDFVVAVAIGGLVGLEREIYQKRHTRGFAGIRTYLVVALLGSTLSYVASDSGWIVVLGGIFLLLISGYFVSAKKGYMGITTELSVVLVYVLSSVAMVPEYQKMAVIFAVVLALLLSFKELLHDFAKNTKRHEWEDTLKFIAMILVILPLLPNKEYTVLGVIDSVNPFKTWLMVVFVSGVSFVGYFISKVLTTSHGIGLSGFLGGLVSSTAVVESSANDSNKNKKYLNSYVFTTIAANVVMGLRVIFEVFVVESSAISTAAIAVIAFSVVGLIILATLISKVTDEDGELDLGSPLSIKPALVFGVIYLLVGFVTKAISQFGSNTIGYWALGFVSGLIDVDAVTLSMANSYSQGDVSVQVVWSTILLAVLGNTLFKSVLAIIFGSKRFVKKVLTALFLMSISSVVVYTLVNLIF